MRNAKSGSIRQFILPLEGKRKLDRAPRERTREGPQNTGAWFAKRLSSARLITKTRKGEWVRFTPPKKILKAVEFPAYGKHAGEQVLTWQKRSGTRRRRSVLEELETAFDAVRDFVNLRRFLELLETSVSRNALKDPMYGYQAERMLVMLTIDRRAILPGPIPKDRQEKLRSALSALADAMNHRACVSEARRAYLKHP